MRYQDLHLQIYRDGQHFAVLARFGEDTVTEYVDLDFGRLLELTDTAFDTPTDAHAVGGQLFDAIVRGGVDRLYQRARGQIAHDSTSGIRIRFHFNPTAKDARRLMRVPWELMFDAKEGAGRFLALDPRTSIVRTIDTSVDVPPPPSGSRRVLLVLAQPQDVPWIDVERDASQVEASFRSIGVEPTILIHARRDTLSQALQDGRFEIVHVMCHGAFHPGEAEGELWLEKDSSGGPDRLPAHLFAEMFVGIPTPRLVCLAACRSGDPGRDRGAQPFGSVAAALAGIGLPAVIAMQTRITDQSAHTFTRSFYERLVLRGESVETALAAARKPVRVQRPDYGDWGIPLLFVRDAPAPAPRAPRAEETEETTGRRTVHRTGGFRDLNIKSGGGPVKVIQKNVTKN